MAGRLCDLYTHAEVMRLIGKAGITDVCWFDNIYKFEMEAIYKSVMRNRNAGITDKWKILKDVQQAVKDAN